MATLEVQALAAADELIAEQGANVVRQSRLVLALAFMQGYGVGLGDGKEIADTALRNLQRELLRGIAS